MLTEAKQVAMLDRSVLEGNPQRLCCLHDAPDGTPRIAVAPIRGQLTIYEINKGRRGYTATVWKELACPCHSQTRLSTARDGRYLLANDWARCYSWERNIAEDSYSKPKLADKMYGATLLQVFIPLGHILTVQKGGYKLTIEDATTQDTLQELDFTSERLAIYGLSRMPDGRRVLLFVRDRRGGKGLVFLEMS